MSTSIHIPEGLHSFHIAQTSSKNSPVVVFLKRVVADLQKWLNSSWAAGMVPGGPSLVPELNVVCVQGDNRQQERPDLICPIRGDSISGLAAIVAVGPRNDGLPYTDEEHRFAEALCEHVSGLLGNERLAQNISKDLLLADEVRRDAELARGIYDRLDHRHPQQVRGLEYSGQCHRADNSGGDFFDFLPSGQHDLVVAIGNVAARGLPAGIMLGGAIASVRALVSRGESLVRIAAELNRTMWELSPEDSFTSFLCARVDASARRLHYVNAGLEPGLLVRAKGERVERLEPTGAVLGLSHRSSYREQTVLFEPGDLLVAFTDGIAESTGSTGVLRILRDGLDCGVQDLANSILATGDSSSDQTVVLVRSNDAAAQPAPRERFELVAA